MAIVTARTVAPGRGPPTAALAASGGSAAQRLRVSSAVAPIRIAGCASPSAVSMTAFGTGAPSGIGRGARQAAAPIVELDRKRLLERRADQAALRERAASQHDQAAASHRYELRRHRELRAGEEVAFDVREDQGVVSVERLAVAGKPDVSAAARPAPAWTRKVC